MRLNAGQLAERLATRLRSLRRSVRHRRQHHAWPALLIAEPGEFVGKFRKVRIGQSLQTDEARARLVYTSEQFIQFEVKCPRIPRLRMLEEEYHQEGDHTRARADYRLPLVGEMERRPGDTPDDHHGYRRKKRRWRTQEPGSAFGESAETTNDNRWALSLIHI